MKTKNILLTALCAAFLLSPQAGAECNCNYSNIVAYVEFPNEAEQQPEVPPCSQYFVVKAYPTFGCIGWEDALALPDLEQSKPVVNRGCNKRQEWVEFTFTNTCRHGKTVPRTARVRIDYGPSGNPDVGKTSQWVDSLHWVTELGFKATGRSAGRLRLEAATLSSALLTPAALFWKGTASLISFHARRTNHPFPDSCCVQRRSLTSSRSLTPPTESISSSPPNAMERKMWSTTTMHRTGVGESLHRLITSKGESPDTRLS